MNTPNSFHDGRRRSGGYSSQDGSRLLNLNDSSRIPGSAGYGSSWEDAELSTITGIRSSLSIDSRRNGYLGSPSTPYHNADRSYRPNDIQQSHGVSPHRYDGNRSDFFIQNGSYSDRPYLMTHSRLEPIPPVSRERSDNYIMQRSSSSNASISAGQAYSPGSVSLGSRFYLPETRYPPSSHSSPVPYHTVNHSTQNIQEYRSEDSWFIRPPSEPNQSVQAPDRRFSDSGQRPLLEPSDAWKRQNEDQERRMSPEYRTIPVDNHPGLDFYRDRPRDNNISTNAFTRHTNDLQFEDRRPDRYSARTHSPIRASPRNSYTDSSWQLPLSPNFMPLVVPSGRRPVHRISARISARPRRSPSPSSVSSSSSASYQHGSRRDSESGSRGSCTSSPAQINPEFQYSREFRETSPKPPRSTVFYSSPKITSSPSLSTDLRRDHLSSTSLRSLRHFVQDSVHDSSNEPKKHRSVSPQSIRSSIRSSSQSPSDLEPATILPNEPDPPSISIVCSEAKDIPVDDPGIDLPGMRFQTDDTVKSSLDVTDSSIPVMNLYSDRSVILVEKDIPPESEELKTVVGESDTHELVQKEIAQESIVVPDIPTESTCPVAATGLVCTPSPEPPPSEVFEAKGTGTSTITGSTPEAYNLQTTLGSQVETDMVEREIPMPHTPIQDFSPSVQADRPSSPLTELVHSSPLKSSDNRETVRQKPASFNVERSGSMNDARSALYAFMKSKGFSRHKTERNLIESIFQVNNALRDLPTNRVSTSNDQVVEEVILNTLPETLKIHSAVSQRLAERFARQAEEFAIKINHLRAEYKAHHDRWKAHCRRLDRMMASTASEGIPTPPTRISRRSAYFGDIVRSDLEMEQIIASLDSEDMMDPNVQAMRNMAIIPDLITTIPHSLDVPYIDDNGFVDDPSSAFDVYEALGSWSEDEKEKFSKAYANHPKQFGAIAQAVPGKTPAQCVLFYYLHKKDLLDFRGVIAKYGTKRKRGRKAGKGKGNALLADIIKPVREEMEGESNFQKHGDRYLASTALQRRHIHDRRRSLILPSRASVMSSVQWGNAHPVQEQSTVPDSSALIQGRSVSFSENNLNGDTSPSITTPQNESQQGSLLSVGSQAQEGAPAADPHIKVKVKRPPGRPPKKHKGPQPVQGSPQKTISYTWTKPEEAEYVRLLSKYGRDFAKIAGDMPAKTALQCRNYYRLHAVDRGLEQVVTRAETEEDFSAARLLL